MSSLANSAAKIEPTWEAIGGDGELTDGQLDGLAELLLKITEEDCGTDAGAEET